jgi:hypothetical protein
MSYRSLAAVEPKTVSIAEKMKKMSDEVHAKLQSKLDSSPDKDMQEAKRCLPHLSKEIEREAKKKGNTSANLGAPIFWGMSSQMSVGLANNLMIELTRCGFKCSAFEAPSKPRLYWLSVDWSES